MRRSVAGLPGGFAKKNVSDRAYWYYQVKTPDGQLQQSYVGTDDTATQALIKRHGDPVAKLAREHRVRMTRATIELGCADISPKHAPVIERLVKARKDIVQAAALIDYVLVYDAVEIAALWQDVNPRGPGWRKRLDEGFQVMKALYPECDFGKRLVRAVG